MSWFNQKHQRHCVKYKLICEEMWTWGGESAEIWKKIAEKRGGNVCKILHFFVHRMDWNIEQNAKGFFGFVYRVDSNIEQNERFVWIFKTLSDYSN